MRPPSSCPSAAAISIRAAGLTMSRHFSYGAPSLQPFRHTRARPYRERELTFDASEDKDFATIGLMSLSTPFYLPNACAMRARTVPAAHKSPLRNEASLFPRHESATFIDAVLLRTTPKKRFASYMATMSDFKRCATPESATRAQIIEPLIRK